MSMLRGLTVGVALTGVACTSVQRVQPSQFVPKNHPAVMTVTTRDSEETKVVSPRIDGDTLRGVVAGLGERVAIPVDQISKAWAQAPNHTLTALVAATSVLAAGGIVFYYANHSSQGDTGQACAQVDIATSPCNPCALTPQGQQRSC